MGHFDRIGASVNTEPRISGARIIASLLYSTLSIFKIINTPSRDANTDFCPTPHGEDQILRALNAMGLISFLHVHPFILKLDCSMQANNDHLYLIPESKLHQLQVWRRQFLCQ
ncbi:unnamed protein product [Timema podura]|uniref:Uncharacterized protein n=1 Tax=Timema podura TaxID=61482 RepID=A0ABN7NS73_TIMPD|nr:unnamed protein product [Timema podura]